MVKVPINHGELLVPMKFVLTLGENFHKKGELFCPLINLLLLRGHKYHRICQNIMPDSRKSVWRMLVGIYDMWLPYAVMSTICTTRLHV
jgi:hypothetical protein